VLNKIDLVPREKLLALAKAANDRLAFEQTFMVSAMTGDGVDDLRRTLAVMVPPGPFHYPEDQMSDAPLRHLAAEITREKIFRQLHQELPYQSTVETDTWTERKDKSVPPSSRSARIHARNSPRSSAFPCICSCS
jgi:GTP-binding protein Era